MTSLQGKIVLVTGAARRIGRSIALRLNREGARVLIHYQSSEEEARETALACDHAPLYRADLESVTEIRALFEQIQRDHGRLDGLVNNAARFTRMNVMDIEESDWDFIHSVNLKSVFFCCQAAGRIMTKQNEGRIVNISSLGGLRPWADHAHYCASKAGVIMLTKTLARALAPRITVNSIAPGVIPFSDAEAQSPEVRPMIRRTPMGRAGDGDEIAQGVVFFLSAPEFITGQILAVDGGLSLA